jgi:hypothetical protein
MANKMQLGELVWKITGDKSGFDKSAKSAEKTAGSLGKAWKGAGTKIAAAFATIGLGALVKRFLEAGSDAEEVAGKFGVVFKDVAKDANAFAKNLADNYLLSRTEAKKLLSDTGDLLSGFGLTGKEALNLSNKVQTLAADLASFSNVQGGVTFASEALTKGLFGETEQMKSLGIVINQNSKEFKESIAQKQRDEGLTLLQAKAYTILEMATRQSKNAIGDVAKTMDSFANQSRIAQSNIKNLEESIGKKLLPIAGLFVKAFNVVAKEVDKTIQSIGNFVSKAEGARIISNIVGKIAGSFAAMWQIAKVPLNALKDGIKILIKTFKESSKGVGTGSTALLSFSAIGNFAAKVIRIVVLLLAGFIRAFFNLANVVQTTGKAVAAFILALQGKGKWEDAKKEIANTGKAFKKLGSDIFVDTKKVVNAFGDLAGSFKKDSDAIAKEAGKAYTKTSQSFQSAVYSALTAKQKNIDKTKESTNENNKNKDSINGLSGAMTNSLSSSSQMVDNFERVTQSMANMRTGLTEASTVLEGFSTMATGLFDAMTFSSEVATQEILDDIDKRLNWELRANNLAFVDDEEKARAELNTARMKGDQQEIIEAEAALKKAQIEKKYAKEAAEVQYKADLESWNLKMLSAGAEKALLIIRSIAAASVAGPIAAAAAGVAATATAGIYLDALNRTKPKRPSFQAGGIVEGASMSGDSIYARVNSGEMILNAAQQQKLFDMANGKGSSGAGDIFVYLGEKLIYKNLYQATKNGDLLIDARSVVAR